ncbi:MAG: hypothetical protein AAFQ63_03155 [Cyanobacteria bacterium J06621_11]
MSLPIVLEIAIGLIFIYLTLSLVASEIQEILSALFQWRAEHLKRSIEQLLAGDVSNLGATYSSASNPQVDATGDGSKDALSAGKSVQNSAHENRQAAKRLADNLYASPLIEDLNYEAKGGISGLLRNILHAVGKLYRIVTFSRNVFGDKTSGPSYIPAEAFATSLIERLKLADFQRLLIRSRFHEFLQDDVRLPLHNTVNELRARLANEELLAAEMLYFDQSIDQIMAELSARRLTLESALAQVISQLQAFENMAADEPWESVGADASMVRSFLGRIQYLRAGLSSEHSEHTTQNAALIARLRPSLSDLTALLDPNSTTYAELVALAQREGAAAQALLEKLQEEIVPPRLRSSLTTLASRAEAKVQATGSDIQQLQQEIEGWFNNGMERASGVYRRNVKGVGLLIGLAIAFTINADTFFMFHRLSTDQAIRSSILQTADQLEVRSIESAEDLAADLSIDQLSERLEGDLRSVGIAVEETLSDYPLPIGRSVNMLAAQQAAESSWPIPFVPQRLIGWLITALALSMGASFWFDLLRKITSVRSSGNKPQ